MIAQVPEVITIQDTPETSEKKASEADDDDLEIDILSCSPRHDADASKSPVAEQAPEGGQCTLQSVPLQD